MIERLMPRSGKIKENDASPAAYRPNDRRLIKDVAFEPTIQYVLVVNFSGHKPDQA